MALKAGRVGVAPDQVDEFGKISSEATEGYTKQEADAKFETQTHAVSTYETKADAAALQPIQLSVPVELLSGSALTVESALHGLSDWLGGVENLTEDIVYTGNTYFTPAMPGGVLYRKGNTYYFRLQGDVILATGDNYVKIAQLPIALPYLYSSRNIFWGSTNNFYDINITADGEVLIRTKTTPTSGNTITIIETFIL